MEKLRKYISSWHHWKQRLKISKIAKFESDLSKTDEEIAPQSRKILRTFVWWGPGTNVNNLPPPPPPAPRPTAAYKRL